MGCRVSITMKLHVRLGPLPIAPPYFDWEEDDEDHEDDLPLAADEEEIDLTDLFDRPTDKERMN